MAVTSLALSRDRLTFLRLRDQHVPHEGPTALRAAARIVEIVRGIGAQTVTVTWPKDPHCDHQATFQIVRLAQRMQHFNILAYPIWAWSLSDNAFIGNMIARGFRLDIHPVLNRKETAPNGRADR